MAIQLSSLTVSKEVKTVREYVQTPQGSIEIYEPTLEMVNQILDIQKENGFAFEEDQVEFDGMTLMKKVFPILTNIETDELTDEEIDHIIGSPSIHLLITQNIVAQIISEANKLYAESMKAELASAETVMAQHDLINSVPSMINEQIKRDPEVAEAFKAIEQAADEVIKLSEAQKQSQEAPVTPVATEE